MTLKRSAMPPRTTRVKARNPKRHAKNQLRAYGPAERREWIASQSCSVPMCPRTPCENAHTASGGVSRKADADTVIPLCRYHHGELHQHGAVSFQRVHRLSLAACAEATARAWRDRQEAA